MLRLSLATFIAFALCACALARPILENVHDVIPGVVVRSAQLSPSRLAELIGQKKIRTVLNLRHPSPGEAWHQQERAVASQAGIEYLDFPLDSGRDVPPAQAQELIALMKRAPKPMLIHCWGGADRTGLASALYLYALASSSAEAASQALSIRYHHLWFTSAAAMDRSFEAFVKSLPSRSAVEDLHPRSVE